jgi:long-chain acyl-CoA synthetase
MHGTAPSSTTANSANDIWMNRVKSFGDRTAFHYPADEKWKQMTWREADDAAREIAAGLLSLGLKTGDKIAILSQTRVEWLLIDVAISLSGNVSVPLYPSCTSQECAFVIHDSGAHLVFVEDSLQLAKIQGFKEGKPAHIVILKEGSGDSPQQGEKGAPISLSTLRKQGREFLLRSSGILEKSATAVRADDLFTIIYTSGTTGQPKGVELTHRNLVTSCESAVRAFDLRPDDVQYLFLPLAHVLGRELEWAPIITGSEVAFTSGLARIKFDLVEIRPTFMAGVPRIFEKLHAAILAGMEKGSAVKRALVSWAFSVGAAYSQRIRKKAALSLWLRIRHTIANAFVLSKLRNKLGLNRCRFLISGGAALSAEIAAFFHEAGLLILEGYGLTETTAAAFVNRIHSYRFGTVGSAIDVVEYRLADDGEILMRGPSVFTQYHQNPTATAEAIDSEGWFHSGDVGVLEGGFLRIVDRKKDILVTTNGKNIAPQKLENALKAHSRHVGQAVVFGDNRPYCIVLVTPSEPAVREFGQGDFLRAAQSPEFREVITKAIDEVNNHLATHEMMKRFAIITHEFSESSGELTPSLKVKRAVVAERFSKEIVDLYLT